MTASSSRAAPEEHFRCEVEPNDESVRLVPFGELDLDTAAVVEEHLRGSWSDGSREIVLDLRNLTFMDSSGLHLVLKTDELARRDGTAFVLIPGSPTIQRLFELTGVQNRLTFRNS